MATTKTQKRQTKIVGAVPRAAKQAAPKVMKAFEPARREAHELKAVASRRAVRSR